MSKNDLRIHFGLGSDVKHIRLLQVYWPSGSVDTIRDIVPNSLIQVREGETEGKLNYQCCQIIGSRTYV